MRQSAQLPRLAVALLVLGLAACGGDLTLPGSSATGLELSVVGGDSQIGTVGQFLPQPVKVQVTADDGTPMAGRRIAFLTSSGDADAGFEPDTAVTNPQGEAFARWSLGTAPGTYMGEARVVAEGDTAVKSVSFQADARAGAPDTLRAVGPTSHPGRRGQTLADPLTVAAVDRYGNPVEGATVQWSLAGSGGGGGALSAEQTPTAADGTASVTWTLGDRVGVQKVEAKVGGASGSPVTFTAVVLF
jgi:hypothetical protein